jgi:hypothetical protein
MLHLFVLSHITCTKFSVLYAISAESAQDTCSAKGQVVNRWPSAFQLGTI